MSETSQRLKLCDSKDAPAPNGLLRCEPEGMDPIALCNVAGVLFAIEDECTHAIATLSEGRLDGEVIFCPLHGGSFNVRTGKACSLPCKQPVRTFAIETAEDAVWLLL